MGFLNSNKGYLCAGSLTKSTDSCGVRHIYTVRFLFRRCLYRHKSPNCWTVSVITMEKGNYQQPSANQWPSIRSWLLVTASNEIIHMVTIHKGMSALCLWKIILQGDSGGPLVCQRCSSCRWYVAGIVSFGHVRCGTAGVPGVYADVLAYEKWITGITKIKVPVRTCPNRYGPWKQNCADFENSSMTEQWFTVL